MLTRRGINEIPLETCAIVFAATMEWLKSADGVVQVADTLGFDFEEGREDREYIVSDPFGREMNVPPQQVTFIKAAVVGGVPTPTSLIEVKEKPVKQCEMCNVESYCVKSVKDRDTHEYMLACNNCLIHNNNPHLRDEGEPSGCMDCPMIECPSHPQREAAYG